MNIFTKDEDDESKPSQDPASDSVPVSFNQGQKLYLRVSCEYMDKMLQEIERALRSEEGASPFSRFIMDMSPAQARVMEDYVRRFRAQLLRALAWQHIEPAEPEIPVTRVIQTRLHFINISISELRPYAMRGTGKMAEVTAAELMGVVKELASISENMMGYVSFELQDSLKQRVERVIASGLGSELLERIEKVVTSRGLVEFRPRLDMLLARMENPTFEVAVFGRVSSGKSSFLNTLLGTDLLPVGANPITAIPTRISYGSAVEASVQFGNRPLTSVSLEEFHELVSETGNPDNQKGVRYALLQVPSPRLSEGIVLVDTPGLGSLALKGARETLAYLPSCDLALLLIDAGATLTPEDIGTLRLILEAGIAPLILLSKADLLREDDRAASIQYIQGQIQRELRVALAVHPISSLHGHEAMVETFYESDLKPRFEQSQALQSQSLHTKLVRLQHDVIASLEAKAQRHKAMPAIDSSAISTLEKRLTDTAGKLGMLERTLEDRILALGFQAPSLIDQIAKERSYTLAQAGFPPLLLVDLSQALQDRVHAEAADLVALLQKTTAEVVSDVRGVGQELHSSGLPEENEITGIIRDAPRFELRPVEGQVELGFWKYFGARTVGTHIARAMRTALLPVARRELEIYSSAFGTWAKNRLRSVQFAINSFADVYRASMQESNGSVGEEGVANIQEDIALLRGESDSVGVPN